MGAKPKVIDVEPEGPVARLLDQAREQPLLLDRGGERFTVRRADDDPYRDYDPERVQASLDRLFGVLRGVDVEALKAELRAQREQDSPGRPAWD